MNVAVKIPFPKFGFDGDSLTLTIVGAAIMYRDDARFFTSRIEPLTCMRDYVGADACRNLAREARAKSYAVAHILRASIRGRTARERYEAQSLVKSGLASFHEVACEGDTCVCGRPLWQHIIVEAGNCQVDILCPKGRRYWTLARAICTEEYAPRTRASETRLGVIAKR